ncbi:MAG: DUF1549 domain-containing protein [Terriglobia bacterium]
MRRIDGKWLAILTLLAAWPTPVRAAEVTVDPAAPLSIRLVPEQVTLWGISATQQFMVLGSYADGLERDVTTLAHYSLSDAASGEITASGKYTARGTSDVTVTARVGERTAQTQIRRVDGEAPRPFTFPREIEAILTKRGCNDPTCHGGVKGRAGFRLSIYGLYPKEDYKWIVEGGTYRVLTPDENPRYSRIDLKQPEKSLILLKPTFGVPHQGGLRFEVGSADYEKIRKWVAAGAPYGDEAEKQGVRIEQVEVTPKEIVLMGGGRQQLVVTATLSNGKREDITDEVRYLSNDDAVAEVTDTGVVQAKKKGETSILIRVLGRTLSSDVGVIEKPIVKYPTLETQNIIDREVFAKLKKFQILPSEPASDAEFLRRVCLDLTGTLPPPQRVREFLADRDPQKRNRLIEILFNSPEYVDYWSFRFSDLLRASFVNSMSIDGAKGYQDWIINSFASNKPYDQMARERIAAQGYSSPARNFYYIDELTTPDVIMPELIRLFMGRRIECAQCHSHPFEAWTQSQYWGLAAFFGGYSELRESALIIDVLGGGHVDQPRDMMVSHPRTKEKVAPAYLDGTQLPQNQWMDPRLALAKWVTTHPYFAEASVNRMWSFFFGRGIVDPVDDFRSTNPPSHPELLKALAREFQESGYDLKHLMRLIVQSRTYQLSSTPNESNRQDKIDYSHALPRPLEAAVLLDAVSEVTGVPEKFEFHARAGGGDSVQGMRAMQTISDVCPSQFMDDFGRSMRKALPSKPPEPNLLEALHMMTGPAFNEKLAQEGSRLSHLLQQKASDEQIVEEFYLAAFSRYPTAEEKSELLKALSQRASRREEALAALLWATLNSREFAYNH